MKVSELVNLDPDTPWLDYINTVLSKDIVQVNSEPLSLNTIPTLFLQISGDEMIIVDVPSYISNFSKLIRGTPARVQVGYPDLG